jgi:hypothetical protein
MNVRVFPVSSYGQRNGTRAFNLSDSPTHYAPEEDHMSRAPIKILLQTTIFSTEDDWAIDRLSQLAKLLAAAVGDDGHNLYDVTARDHGPLEAPDPVLSTLDKSHFDQVWLFALDIGDGLTPQDSDAISPSGRRPDGDA